MAQPSVLKSSQPHSVSLPEGSSVATRKAVRKPADKEPQASPGKRNARRAGTLQDAPAAVPAIIARDAAAETALTDLPAMAAPATEAPAPMSDAIARRLEELRRRNDTVRATLARQATAGRSKTP